MNFYKKSLTEICEWLQTHRQSKIEDYLVGKISNLYPYFKVELVLDFIIMTNSSRHEIRLKSYDDSWFVVTIDIEVSDDNWSSYNYLCDDEIGLFEVLDYMDCLDLKSLGMRENMKYIDSYKIFEKLNFNKKSKKKGAKTDTYNVSKSNKVIGQVKWSSRNRGYAFLPPPDCDTEINTFVKDLMRKRRENKKKGD